MRTTCKVKTCPESHTAPQRGVRKRIFPTTRSTPARLQRADFHPPATQHLSLNSIVAFSKKKRGRALGERPSMLIAVRVSIEPLCPCVLRNRPLACLVSVSVNELTDSDSHTKVAKGNNRSSIVQDSGSDSSCFSFTVVPSIPCLVQNPER